MKKTFFTLMLMLVSALSINAQSLTGKEWCTVLNDEEGHGIAVELTFEKSGSCQMVIATQEELKEDGVPITIVGGVTVNGTYTLNDKDLKINFNNDKAEVELDYEIKGMDAKTKSLMDKQIRSELNGMKGEFKKEMLGGMPKMDDLKIVSLEAKRLILKNTNNQEIPFYSK